MSEPDVGLYPRDGVLAEEKLRALATPYAQAVAGTPLLMRWDTWWRTLSVEYVAASPRQGDIRSQGDGMRNQNDATGQWQDLRWTRTTELHVAAGLHYPGMGMRKLNTAGCLRPTHHRL